MTETTRPTVLVLASTYPRWSGDPEPGFVHELCRRLTSRFEMVALVPDAPQADANGVLDGVEVVRFRYAPRRWQTLVNNGGITTNLRRHRWKWLLVPGFVLGQYLAARRLLRERRISVVHAHWLIPQGMIARHLQRTTGISYLVTSHGGDLFGLRGRWLETIKRRVASSAAAMTVVSTAMRDEARRLKLQPPKLAVLPMGVDLRQRFVANPHVDRNPDELLFVGRLVAKKGLAYLLSALPLVLARRPATVLTIVGFGPEESALRKQAASLGVAGRVRFLGATPQAELPGLYRRAGVFVAPFIRDDSGNQEGLPVVLMEAIGCGCPVVVGRVAGISDLLGDVADEISVDAMDPHALAAMLLATLDDPASAGARTLRIRDEAAGRIDWQVIADGYAELIEGCLRDPASSKESG